MVTFALGTKRKAVCSLRWINQVVFVNGVVTVLGHHILHSSGHFLVKTETMTSAPSPGKRRHHCIIATIGSTVE